MFSCVIKDSNVRQVHHAAVCLNLTSSPILAFVLSSAQDAGNFPHFHWQSPAGLTGISISRKKHPWLSWTTSNIVPKWVSKWACSHLAWSNVRVWPCLWCKVHCSALPYKSKHTDNATTQFTWKVSIFVPNHFFYKPIYQHLKKVTKQKFSLTSASGE